MECEGIWIKRLLGELGVSCSPSIQMMCDNQAAISIAKNLVHHDRKNTSRLIDILSLKRLQVRLCS